jgi:excisionase family DNA binding protein
MNSPIRERRLVHLNAPRLLRLKEAAHYLAVSPWKLRQLIWAGKLPYLQDSDGSPLLLDVVDLDKFVERNKRSNAS